MKGINLTNSIMTYNKRIAKRKDIIDNVQNYDLIFGLNEKVI